MSLPLDEKLRAVLDLQKVYVGIAESRRPVEAWRHPWTVKP